MYKFGKFTLDPASVTLVEQGGTEVAVEPQVFQLLLLLIENRHRILNKEELVATIWKGRIVSDSAIASRIKYARQAIGDNGKDQLWIKTVHGFGFRFVGEIQRAANQGVTSSESSSEPNTESTGLPLDSRPSIVVLPFKTAASHTEEVFAEGLSHDIITSLSRLRWLKVISRATAFRLSQTPTDSSAAEVKTKYCVSGFLNRIGNSVEVSVRLDDVQNDMVLWADRIAFAPSEVDEMRLDVVYRIINHLEIQISEHEAQLAMFKSTESLNAWEAYHLGLSHFFRFTEKDNQVALGLFKKATSIDPGFARAHAGLSSAAFQNAFNAYRGVNKSESTKQAIDHAEQSIALDKMDPLANFVMGRVNWLTKDPQSSLPWLERAVALNPNYAQGYYARGLASLLSDDSSRSYGDSDRAMALSPLDPLLYGFHGIRAFSFLADGDIENAYLWAEKSARHPEALAVMPLLAAAMCQLTQRQSQAEMWIGKAKSTNAQINSRLFFSALPFNQGRIRQQLEKAFNALNI